MSGYAQYFHDLERREAASIAQAKREYECREREDQDWRAGNIDVIQSWTREKMAVVHARFEAAAHRQAVCDGYDAWRGNTGLHPYEQGCFASKLKTAEGQQWLDTISGANVLRRTYDFQP